MFESIGCFYSFDRCVIVSSIKINEKIELLGEYFNHVTISEISIKLKSFKNDNKIWINKHPSLNACFNGKLNELDFTNENDINEMIDIYKSLDKENVLLLKNIDKTKNHHLQALYLAIKGLNYYQYKDEFIGELGTIEPFNKMQNRYLIYRKKRYF